VDKAVYHDLFAKAGADDFGQELAGIVQPDFRIAPDTVSSFQAGENGRLATDERIFHQLRQLVVEGKVVVSPAGDDWRHLRTELGVAVQQQVAGLVFQLVPFGEDGHGLQGEGINPGTLTVVKDHKRQKKKQAAGNESEKAMDFFHRSSVPFCLEIRS